jgi:hemerythrin-like domain-containing protein
MAPEGSGSRRGFLWTLGGMASALSLGGGGAAASPPEEKGEEEVSPPEDLMREHGVLKRVMMVYAEILRRMAASEDFPPETLGDSARIIRSFVEDYHEKLEEDYLFPRFEKAHRLVDLVGVLRAQHQAGRRVTDVVLSGAAPAALRDPAVKQKVAAALQAFNRMYGPHEAREDTVLFPAFRGVVSAHEFDSLGEEFEKKEDRLFGEDGFGKVVDRVAAIEKRLGIYDLAQFTPAT